jgi:hypothetical protein
MNPIADYPCVARIYASATDGDAVGELAMPMPFVPEPGVRIADIDRSHESFEIEQVTWDPGRRVILLDVESVSDKEADLAALKAELNPGFTWSDEKAKEARP